MYFDEGRISLIKIYRICYFLEYGYKKISTSTRVPAKWHDSLIKKYNLSYNSQKKRYYIDEDVFFNMLKSEYPLQFKRYGITDLSKLCYLAL